MSVIFVDPIVHVVTLALGTDESVASGASCPDGDLATADGVMGLGVLIRLMIDTCGMS